MRKYTEILLSISGLNQYSHMTTKEICSILLGNSKYAKIACIYNNGNSKLVSLAKTGKISGLLVQSVVHESWCLHLR